MGLLGTLLGHATDVTPEESREDLEGILLPDEPVEVAFKVVRDLFVFTDKRLILVDKQGLTGPEGRLPGGALQGDQFIFDRNGRHARHGLGAQDLDLRPGRSHSEDAQARRKHSRDSGCHRGGSMNVTDREPRSNRTLSRIYRALLRWRYRLLIFRKDRGPRPDLE